MINFDREGDPFLTCDYVGTNDKRQECTRAHFSWLYYSKEDVLTEAQTQGWTSIQDLVLTQGILYCPDHKPSAPRVLPHSGACGAWAHPHGIICHSNCPTCHGRELTA